MSDIMLDIETLATHNNAVITQIGACYFDRSTGKIGETFLVNIDIQSCLDSGLEVDGGAIKFWLNQSNRSFLETPIRIGKALFRLSKFIDTKAIIWAHATFDFPILNNAFKKVYAPLPYLYYNLRDIRTLTDLAGVKRRKSKVIATHNALEDCIRQVKYCKKYFKKIKYI